MAKYFINEERVRELLESRHWPVGCVADQLAISRGHWTALLNGRTHASVSIRRRMLASVVFTGVPEEELWSATADTANNTTAKQALSPAERRAIVAPSQPGGEPT